jgi:PAS domain S-box-containing protein
MEDDAAAIETLKRDSEMYHALIASMDEGYILADVIFDAAGRAVDIAYIEGNRAAEQMLGTNLAGRRLREFERNYEDYWYEIWGRVATTGKSERLERFASPRGIWYDFHIFKLNPSDSDSRRVAVLFRDATARKRAEIDLNEASQRLQHSEKRYRALATAGANWIYRMSPDWRVMYELDGQTLGNMSGPLENWQDQYIFPDDRRRVANAIAQATGSKCLLEIEHRFRHPDGSIAWVLSRAVPMLNADGEIIEWFGVASDVTERRRAVEALQEGEERFRQFASAAASGLWIRNAGSLEMEYVSPAMATIHGAPGDTLMGGVERWAALLLPQDRADALTHVEAARAGTSVVHEFRIQRQDDHSFRWLRNTHFPLRDAEGEVRRIGGIVEDVTPARLAVEHQGILLAELQHRVRNTLGMIRSIVNRTAKGATSVEDYRERLEGRLLALARVQALLTRTANAGVSLRGIIESEVGAQAHHPAQLELDGSDLLLPPKVAEVLTLAFHELATNALKYGALMVPEGRVRVRWTVSPQDGEQWLTLDWIESGGLPPPPASRRGFGSELIEARIPYELSGTGKVTIGPEGAHCHMAFPLRDGASILETDAPAQVAVHAGSLGHGSPAGRG